MQIPSWIKSLGKPLRQSVQRPRRLRPVSRTESCEVLEHRELLTAFVPERPLLLVPGVGGTFAKPEYASEWFSRRGLEPEKMQLDPLTNSYTDLMETLKGVGYSDGRNLFAVTYDWRMPPAPAATSDAEIDGVIRGLTAAPNSTASANSITDSVFKYGVDYLGYFLKKATEAWKADHNGVAPGSVDVIIHSTGGLITRSYIQSGDGTYGGSYAVNSTLPKVHDFLMIAAPHRGASKAWPIMQDDWDVENAYRIVLSKMAKQSWDFLQNGPTGMIAGPDPANPSAGSITKTQINASSNPKVEFISQYVPTANSLLATYDFLKDVTTVTSTSIAATVQPVDINSGHAFSAHRNSLLLDLNDGLDRFYDMSQTSSQFAFHDGTRLRDPNRFASLLVGTDATALQIYGHDLKTPVFVNQHKGRNLAVEELLSFTQFVGEQPRPDQIWFEDIRKPNGGDETVPLESSIGQFVRSISDPTTVDPRIRLFPVATGSGEGSSSSHGDLPWNKMVQNKILLELGVLEHELNNPDFHAALAEPANHGEFNALWQAFQLGIVGKQELKDAIVSAWRRATTNPAEFMATWEKLKASIVQTVVSGGCVALHDLADIDAVQGLLRTKLPFVDKPLGELINVDELIHEHICTPLTKFAERLSEGISLGDVVTNGTLSGFTISLSTTITKRLADFGFDIDAGLQGLGLDVSGQATTGLQLQTNLNFGVNLSDFDVFVRTDGVGPELKVAVGFTPQIDAQGQLGFLSARVKSQSPSGTSSSPFQVRGEVSLDLHEPSGDGQLTLTELGNTPLNQLISAGFSGGADLHFSVITSVGANFPSYETDLDINWEFGGGGTGIGFPQFGGLPSVSFNNVRLNVGEYFRNFVKPILVNALGILDPVRPVIAFLNRRIPVISDLMDKDVSLIDIAGLMPGSVARVADFVDALGDLDRLITLAESLANTGTVRLGSFDLNGTDVRSTTQLSEATARPTSVQDIRAQLSSSSAATEFFNTTASVGNSAMSFPLLTNPSQAFSLLLGKDVDLFRFDVPKLEVQLAYSQFFPIIGPLGARFTGSIGAMADFTFGFDTAGLRQFRQTRDVSDILNGFYVDAGTGPEIGLTGRISAAAELNAIVASAGIEGGISANVNFDLRDPNRDGKIRMQEIADNLDHGFQCLFDISGQIEAGLRAYVKVLVFKKRFNIATVTFPFEHHCDQGEPVLAALDADSGILTLNMGPRAAQRQFGNLEDGSESFRILPGSTGGIIVEARGHQTECFGVRRIVAEGGLGDDTIEISPDVAVPAELWGDFRNGSGAGNDVLIGGRSLDQLHGGAGNDELYGNGGSDQLYGGSGSDWIEGGEGGDTIEGGADDDELSGDEGQDFLYGGDGHDFLDGGEDSDTLQGNAGNDELTGSEGADSLSGDAGEDALSGGMGDDTLRGGDGNDILYGDADHDAVYGGNGEDQIHGGTGSDFLYGEAGNDAVCGLDSDQGDLLDDGADLLSGGDGNDLLRGGQGDDTLNGGAGLDQMFGESGNDTFQVTFEGLNTALVDQLFGGPHQDVIEVLGTQQDDELRVQQISAGGFRIENYRPGTTELLSTYAFSLPENPLDRDIELLKISALAGNDTILAQGSFNVNLLLLDGGTGDDILQGSTGRDRILGGDGNDTLRGNAGEDVIIGGAGNDLIDGGDGTDVLYGDSDVQDQAIAGDDKLVGGAGRDVVYGGPGNDRLESGTGMYGDTLYGEAGLDVLIGGPGIDQLYGGDDADTILGGDLGDFVSGGKGNDVLIGEFGRDTINGDEDHDTIRAWIDNTVRTQLGLTPLQELTLIERHQQENELGMELETLTPQKQFLENLPVRTPAQQAELEALSDQIQFIGLAIADLQIYGSIYVDTLSGGPGNDQLYGSPLLDSIDGGTGNDRIFHVSGTNSPSDMANGDTITGGEGDDTYFVSGSELADDIVVQLDAQSGSNPNVYVKVNGQTTRMNRLDVEVAGVLALGGDDVVTVNFGNNAAMKVEIDGGDGNDTLNAGGDASLGILPFQHNAILRGGLGHDRLTGGTGHDTLFGGDGDDILVGGNGNDTLAGESGNDSLNGGDGNDALTGGLGDDVYVFDNTISVQTDTVTELVESGTDTLSFSGVTSAVSADLRNDAAIARHAAGTGAALRTIRTGAAGQAAHFENVTGGSGGDTLVGNASNNKLVGNGGNDVLTSLEGADVLDGGDGSDRMTGGTGDDTYVFADTVQAQSDVVLESVNGGSDTLSFASVSVPVSVNLASDTATASHAVRTVRTDGAGMAANFENVIGGTASDILQGNHSANRLSGSAGSDSLYGLAGNDTLDGGEGNDSLVGGLGDDTYAFFNALSAQIDTLSELPSQGTDTVSFAAVTNSVTGDLSSDTNLAIHSLRTVRTSATGQAANFENLIGGSDSDRLIGNAADNLLKGNAGHDTLISSRTFDVSSATASVGVMVAWGSGMVTAFSDNSIWFSPDGKNLSGGGSSVRMYSGTQRALSIVPYAGGVVTAFADNSIWFSPDGRNLGGGGGTIRVYSGTQSIVRMVECRGQILAAFSGKGIYLWDARRVFGGAETTRVYSGANLVHTLVPYANGVITSFSDNSIWFSPDAKNLGGGGTTVRVYTGTQSVASMIPYAGGVVTAFADNSIWFSPDGRNPGGGGNTVRVYSGTERVVSMALRGTGVVTAFSGGGVYYSTDGRNLGSASGNTRALFSFRSGAKPIAVRAYGNGLITSFSDRRIYYSPNGEDIGPSHDTHEGDSGNDFLFGGVGNDRLNGGLDSNTIDAGAGDDEIFVGLGTHRVNGGAGSNRLVAVGDDFANTIQLLPGTSGGLSVRGFGSTDATGISSVRLEGRGGNDNLSADSRLTIPVTMYGGTGNDTLRGGSGNDFLFGGTDPKATSFAPVNDGDDTIYGGAGHDFLHGGEGIDRLFGEDGNDTLDGGDGSPTAKDLLNGGGGADSFIVHEGIPDMFLDYLAASGDLQKLLIS